MRITLDTNVLYQALRSSLGASYTILSLVRARQLEMAISIPVFLEYQEVLLRPGSLRDLGRSPGEMESILRFIAYIAKPVTIDFLMRPNLADENDNMFVDLALASGSRFLVTSNVDDFTRRAELKLDSFRVVTPGQFYKLWRRLHERKE
jgi:putative PIN family toxin of toxin-antitoxin system